MGLFDYINRNIPEYDKFMYLDGYSSIEIMQSLKNKIYQEQAERIDKESEINNIKVICEVKVK